jgi:hypothetical protein
MDTALGERWLLALLLVLGAAETAPVRAPVPDSLLLTSAQGPPRVLPDLAHDGAERLAWLPRVGVHRAQVIVAERPYLGLPLTPERLPLLRGIGATTARAVAEFYDSEQR